MVNILGHKVKILLNVFLIIASQPKVVTENYVHFVELNETIETNLRLITPQYLRILS